MSQDWRNKEPRIRTREESAPTPSAKKSSRGAITFTVFCVLLLVCAIASVFVSIKVLLNTYSAPANDNHVATTNHQQPFLTMEELEEQYGNWDVDSWNDDLSAVEIHIFGWLNSGKELGRKEATVRIAPEDYRVLKAVALMKNHFFVYRICEGVRDERTKK